jgi:hypothetical protein
MNGSYQLFPPPRQARRKEANQVGLLPSGLAPAELQLVTTNVIPSPA